MYRSVLIVTLVVLFLAGRAQASVGRTQDFHVGAVNRVVWAGGIGSASSDGQGSFTQTQEFSDHSGRLSARQMERGSVTQTATVGGAGPGTARQSAIVNGGQNLQIDTLHGFPNRAQQDLTLKLGMRLVLPSGVGTATDGGTANGGTASGVQTYTGAQEQTVTTPCGTSSQSQSVDVRQSGSILTQTNIDPAVKNTINIGLHQTQANTGP